jgi:hypothetical protein
MIFFCILTTEVHFFSRRPSYLLVVASSKFGPNFDSSLREAALFDRPTEVRYATMDLCLKEFSYAPVTKGNVNDSQLFCLPVRKD